MQLPSPVLIAMWVTGIVGLFFMSKELIRRFG